MAVEEVTFNVLSDPYATFISNLRGHLAGGNPEKVRDRPVLAKQTGDDKPPPRWIHVVLKGKGAAAPKVAIRSDNVYIFAFTNSQGRWFKLTKGKTAVLPDATPLGFDGHYQTLVGGVNNLTTLKLGKFNTSDAATALWNHTQKQLYEDDNGVLRDDQLKKAVATLCVAVSEAARLAPVHNVVNRGWDAVAGGPSITAQEVKYIRDWSDISTALLGWKSDGHKNDAKWFKNVAATAGVRTGEEALAVLQLLLNKPPKKGLLALLKYLWGLLVAKQEQQQQLDENDDKASQLMEKKKKKPKSSAIVNPL